MAAMTSSCWSPALRWTTVLVTVAVRKAMNETPMTISTPATTLPQELVGTASP